MIQRNDLAGLIPEPVSREIFQGVVEQSSALKHGRRLPNMTSKTQSINVLDMLPMAYWVEGDTGYKETAAQAWEKKRLYAEELAVIIPIPEAVLADTNYDIWGEVKPRIVEAMGRRIDEAILFGTNKPSTWRDSILETAVGAGCTVTEFPAAFAVSTMLSRQVEGFPMPKRTASSMRRPIASTMRGFTSPQMS